MDWLFISPFLTEQLQLQGIDPTWWMLTAYAVWIGASGLVAWLAGRKGLNAGIVFVISVAVSPLAGLIYFLLIKDKAAEAGLLRSFGKTWMKPVTLVLLVAPFIYLAVLWILGLNGVSTPLGFDPVKWTHHYLGDTAIRILLVTLAISPIRDITGWAPIALIRRRIGLAAFFYATLHMLAYLGLDKGWSLQKLWEDVVIRTYITLGMLALLLMIPLALTSNNSAIRKLGRQTWDRIHWLIFPLAILAVAHNMLMQKTLWQMQPTIHMAILVLLLGWRVTRWGAGKLKPKPAEAAA
jgi:sulfoxide reductase heme-binding subunit YedZ